MNEPTVQEAVDAIGNEGSRTASAFRSYKEAAGDRRLQHLVVTFLAESGYARGETAWGKKIDGETYVAGLEAVQSAVSLLAELERDKRSATKGGKARHLKI